ncbi:MAG: glutathione S-transferase family protein [Alphaproteobacteria bacterium]|nr:glutathione S-transferase family protein [Alphaproteobacteria bacterium]
MSTLTIYGIAASRTLRSLWIAKELGLDYEHRAVDFGSEEIASAAYLALNPNGTIPTIKDGDFPLWESAAIGLYLAKKYGKGLYPETLEGEAKTWQWSFFAHSEVEKPILAIAFNRYMKPEAERVEALAKEAEANLVRPLAVLNQTFAKSAYLLGDKFMVADLILAGCLYTAYRFKYGLAAAPKVADWLARCLERPAAQAARKLREG